MIKEMGFVITKGSEAAEPVPVPVFEETTG